MSDNNSTSWMIDDIVIGKTAKRWLKNRNLLPGSWGLADKTVERIKNANIGLTMMSSPASFLKLQPNPLKNSNNAGLIIVDLNAIEDSNFTRRETIATMLHEIGHALFAADYTGESRGLTEEEKAADDFACECGYGNDIASGLKKLAKTVPKKFGNEAVRARIKRIEGRS